MVAEAFPHDVVQKMILFRQNKENLKTIKQIILASKTHISPTTVCAAQHHRSEFQLITVN